MPYPAEEPALRLLEGLSLLELNRPGESLLALTGALNTAVPSLRGRRTWSNDGVSAR